MARTITASSQVEDQVREEAPVTTPQVDEARSSATRANSERSPTERAKNERLSKAEKVRKFLNLIDRPKLDIPEEVRKRFREEGEGFELRWVRYREHKNGQDDLANVNRKGLLGYEFVKAHEVPELSGGMRPVSHNTFGDLITIDELALAKLPIEDADAYREALAKKVDDASQGIVSTLNDPRFKKFIKPVEDL